MPGYLLDTNHLSALFQKEPSILQKIAALPAGVQLRVCVITLGEAEAGHQMTRSTNQPRRDAYTAYVNKEFLPNAIGVSVNTRTYYADIMGRVWNKNRPKKKKLKTERHLVNLGVDVNDIWISAVAWEHNLILVTSDAMTAIKEVAPEIHFENWL